MPKNFFEDSIVKKYLNKHSFNASDEKKLRKHFDKDHTFQGVDDLMQRFQNQRRKNYVKRQSNKCKKPQPGFYAGYPRIKNKRKYTCKNMNNRVLADNKHITTTSFSKKCPKGYYMGALAVNPGKTYHFYRQDDDGYWSHKNGKYKATRYDASGKLIKNPKQADRIYKRRMHRYPDFLLDYMDDIPIHYIGRTRQDHEIKINMDKNQLLYTNVEEVRNMWEETSFELEKLQANPLCVEEERKNVHKEPTYNIPGKIQRELALHSELYCSLVSSAISDPKVAILREEGSNGDAEMTAAFKQAGFEVWDVNMNDLLKNPTLLQEFRGIAFVGGFSYSDVFGAAKGWSATIKFNKELQEQFDIFYNNPKTFSFGVCNGCQLMAELGWIPECKFEENVSNRFESRFSTVKVSKSNAIMMKSMEEMVMGIWVAHGEGRYVPKDDICEDSSIVMQYVNSKNEPTTEYPFNPNGSISGITGICSKDGRHLAMMPHPERCFLNMQLPYNPLYNTNNPSSLPFYSPWFKMFKNAYEWCYGASSH